MIQNTLNNQKHITYGIFAAIDYYYPGSNQEHKKLDFIGILNELKMNEFSIEYWVDYYFADKLVANNE